MQAALATWRAVRVTCRRYFPFQRPPPSAQRVITALARLYNLTRWTFDGSPMVKRRMPRFSKNSTYRSVSAFSSSCFSWDAGSMHEKAVGFL